MAALPKKFRTPLVLCYLEGLTLEEAAFRLGWTATTVKGRFQVRPRRRQAEQRGIQRLHSGFVFARRLAPRQAIIDPLEPMLAKLESAIPSGATLRSLRALRVLEHAGATEAQKLLRELAGGAEGAALTLAAQAARMRRIRRVSTP